MSSETHGTSDIPPSTDVAAQAYLCNYFEFHIKLRLPRVKLEAQQAAMKDVGQRHHAHVSRNAFKKDTGTGDVMWFMTLRMYGVAHGTSFELFEKCVADVREQGLEIVSMQREYAMYDSNVALDKGWIEALIPASPGAFRTLPK